jgi:myo-inositol-1(or 4)-monophosphatase
LRREHPDDYLAGAGSGAAGDGQPDTRRGRDQLAEKVQMGADGTPTMRLDIPVDT